MFCLTTSALAQSAEVIEARKVRVEQGLSFPVSVIGNPVNGMRLADRMAFYRVPGVSIALINNGKIEWVKAYGFLDKDTRVVATPKTLFQAASIGKSFTAVALMRMVERGDFDLDADIHTYLKSWKIPENKFTQKQSVSLRNLLNHTAGMPSGGVVMYTQGQAMPSLLQELKGEPPSLSPAVFINDVPSANYVYSSIGYGVLQLAMSDYSGLPFNALMQRELFKPLGMSDSHFSQPLAPELRARAASAHVLDGSVMQGKWRSSPVLASAGLWTTPTDIAKLIMAIQKAEKGSYKKFLTQARAKQMLTPGLGRYGLGFEMDISDKQDAFGHSGANQGIKALFFGSLQAGQGAVVMTNGDYGSPLIDEIMRSISTAYGWSYFLPIEKSAIAQNPARFDQFIGKFAVSGTTLLISREADHLYIEGPPIGPTRLQLVQSGENTFFLREKDVTLEFKFNQNELKKEPINDLIFVDGRPRSGKRIPSN